MEYVIIGITLGLCLFSLWCYRRGLKDGLALQQGKPLEPIQNPVQSVIRHIEHRAEQKDAKTENDKISEGLANLMSYDGTPQKAGE